MQLSKAESEPINVVLACDNAFGQHAYITAASLLESSSRIIALYFLAPKNFLWAQRFRDLQLTYKNVTVRVLEIDHEVVSNFITFGHIRTAAYYRLLLDIALPTEIERVIYLDSDIIVRAEIADLWSYDIGHFTIAAVADCNELPEVKAKLELEVDSPYFNSGVMLINVKRWRDTEVRSRTLQFCSKHPEKLTYGDQCALNRVLLGNVTYLDPIWNAQTGHFGSSDDARNNYFLESARVVHFTTQYKPWHYQCRHPLKSLYWSFLTRSPWRAYIPPDRTFQNICRRSVRNILSLGRYKFRS